VGPGCPTVLIGGLPAAVIGDMCVCVGPPDTIALGSTGVFIGGKPAARMGDQCIHGGAITLGCPTVMIGETGSGSGSSGGTDSPSSVADLLNSSHKTNTAEKAAADKKINDFDNKPIDKKSIACQFLDQDGNAVAGIRYQVKLPSGDLKTGYTDENGEINITGIDPGNCELSLPDLHKDEWKQS
jgi:hypothetical protein